MSTTVLKNLNILLYTTRVFVIEIHRRYNNFFLSCTEIQELNFLKCAFLRFSIIYVIRVITH